VGKIHEYLAGAGFTDPIDNRSEVSDRQGIELALDAKDGFILMCV
jgi:hypothetical protein